MAFPTGDLPTDLKPGDPAHALITNWANSKVNDAQARLADLAEDIDSAEAAAVIAQAAADLAQAAAEDAVDISQIAVSDDVVEALVKGSGGAGPKTRLALGSSTGPIASFELPRVSGRANGLKYDGTDEAATFESILNAMQAFGGGKLVLEGMVRLDRPPVIVMGSAGATTPTQKPMRITSEGSASRSGQWVTNVLNGGAGLDLRYDGSDPEHLACFDTRGVGHLEIDHLNIVNGGSANVLMFQTTNTTVHIHHNLWRGNMANVGTACVQDAIALGGTTTVLGSNKDAPFQGYGSHVHDNHFDRIRVGVLGRMYCNSVTISTNVFTPKCGNDGTVRMGGAIEIEGQAVGRCVGNLVTGNTIEVTKYKYGVALNYATSTRVLHNGFWDPPAFGSGDGPYVAAVYLGPFALQTSFDDGWHSPEFPIAAGPGKLNTTIRTHAVSRGSFYPGNPFFRGRTAYIPSAGGRGPLYMANNGDGAYVQCSGGQASNPSYPEVVLGTTTALLVTDVVTTSGSPIITSATAGFTPEQEFAPLALNGVPAGTLIARYISATSVELTATATATATGVTAQIGRPPGGGTFTSQLGLTRNGHIVTKGVVGAAAPVATAAGTVPNGATATAAGTDAAFQVTVTTAGTGSLAAGPLATVTYGVAYSNAGGSPGQRFGIAARNAAAAAAMPYLSTTTGVLTINVAAAPTNGATLIYDLVVLQA